MRPVNDTLENYKVKLHQKLGVRRPSEVTRLEVLSCFLPECDSLLRYISKFRALIMEMSKRL